MRRVVRISILALAFVTIWFSKTYATSTQLILDGTQSTWAVNELREAFSLNLTYPTVMNNFKRDITREEFSTIAVKLYEGLTGKKASYTNNPFVDTRNTEVLKAYSLGIVNGKSKTEFKPLDRITRQEISVMLYRTLNVSISNLNKDISGTFPFKDQSSISSWAMEAMKFVYKNKIMNGVTSTEIRPLENTSREQAVILVKRTYENYKAQVTSLPPVLGVKDEICSDGTCIDIGDAKTKGLVKVGQKGLSTDKFKVMITKGTSKYYYPLTSDGVIVGFPLQMGNGDYSISIMKNVGDNRYAYVKTESVNINLSNPNVVYLNSIQTIKWGPNSAATVKNIELIGRETDLTKRLNLSYDFVVKNVKYDYEKIKYLSTDYTPNPDQVLDVLSGICYDYSSLYAAMKRSEGIPIKLVKGYNKDIDVYHAWNEVYINGKWVVVDTTFDAVYYSRNVNYTFAKNPTDYSKVYEY
ncbi:MAG: S-layer homology domain-containing protein [Clostridia bacterium]|nr:S-layer homology domain-containing protein [Clostridia bacterium]